MNKDIKIKKLYVLVSNLFIGISYLLILSTVGLHGWDDTLACKYYYNFGIGLSETVNSIVDRAINWNMRIGEILYFIIGCFNKYVFWITASIIYIIFTNLIVYFALGKKKFKDKKYVAILLIIVHLLNLVVSPVASEVFYWMGGIYNHLFSLMLALIVMIPFRDMLDGNRSDTLTTITPKYIIYLVLCFLVGFGSEATTGTVILSIFIANIIIFIKDKKVDKLKILPLIVLSISYILFLFLSRYRIEIQGISEYNRLTHEHMISHFVQNRLLEFILLIIVTIIYFVFIKLSDKKELKKILFIFACTLLSMFVMLFATYFFNRAVIIIDAGVSIIIVYFVYKILEKLDIKVVNIILYILLVIYTIYSVYIQRSLYKDYNEYIRLRDKYILLQINENISPVKIELYNNEEIIGIYNMYKRYIEAFEASHFFEEEIKFKYNYDGKYIFLGDPSIK